MRLIALAVLSLPLAAQAAPSLSIEGECPGLSTIEITGLTPGGNMTMLFSAGLGEGAIPAGGCGGTITGLDPVRWAMTMPDVDGDGRMRFSPFMPESACGKHVQIMDPTDCSLSGIATIGDGGPAPEPEGCQGGADMTAVSPGGDMVLCDDPADITCEQDFGTLCPVDWHLCSPEEYNSRNDGWLEPLPATQALGTIYCRSGDSGAGHYTLTYAGIGTLGEDEALNCGYGSSRATCETGYGCNETTSLALCCAPNPSCGNGIVDSVEELCDDANDDETDACLSNCTWRNPTSNGLGGIGC